MIQFQGQSYFDDRLYVLYLCKVSLDFSADGLVRSTIFHEESPAKFSWCVVTFQNCLKYPIFSMKLFDSKDEGRTYLEKIEPETPLISLRGKSPGIPLKYDEYLSWKSKCNYQEYDYKKMFAPGEINPRDVVFQNFAQFLSSNPDFKNEGQTSSIAKFSNDPRSQAQNQ